MILKNETSEDIFLGFISNVNFSSHKQIGSSNGVNLPADGSVEVDDSFRGNPYLQDYINEGTITVSSLSVDDDDDTGVVSSGEFNSHMRGIYRIDDGWAAVGTIANTTAYILTTELDGPFDIPVNGNLQFIIDNIPTLVVTIDLPSGVLTKAGLIALVNANAEFAKYAVMATATPGFTITTKSLGVNSKIEVKDNVNSVAKLVGLEDATPTAGTGGINTVTIETFNASGEGVQGVTHAVKVYTTDIGGGSTVDTDFQIQRVTVGKIEGGVNSAQASLTTAEDGKLVFEVARVTDDADATFVGIAVPAAHFIAAALGSPDARVALS